MEFFRDYILQASSEQNEQRQMHQLSLVIINLLIARALLSILYRIICNYNMIQIIYMIITDER